MRYFAIVFLFLFFSSAWAQTTEDDFLSGELVNPEEVTILFLENKNLTDLPDTFEKFVNLETLYLSGNQLTNLPKSLTSLKSLKTLDLSDNKLKQLPENFKNLENLEMLLLNNNQLTSFDISICSFKNLDFLHINNNLIPAIPDCIADLSKLTSVGIGGNPFTSFPSSITKLSNLEILLYENGKANLPNLKSLKKLDRLFINKSFYAKNKSKIKALLPAGCKVNPAPMLPPPIIEPKNFENDNSENIAKCFVNVAETATANKVEILETLIEFGYSTDRARLVTTTTLHEGENIRQKIEDAKKEGMQIVAEMSVELIDGTFSIEKNVLTFKGEDSKKIKTFKITYKQKTKVIQQLTEISTSQIYKTGPCFAPMPSIGN